MLLLNISFFDFVEGLLKEESYYISVFIIVLTVNNIYIRHWIKLDELSAPLREARADYISTFSSAQLCRARKRFVGSGSCIACGRRTLFRHMSSQSSSVVTVVICRHISSPVVTVVISHNNRGWC